MEGRSFLHHPERVSRTALQKRRPWQPGDLGLRARIVILSGTEALENLHGVLDVMYMVGDPFDTYSGRIHFDPE